MDNRTFLLKSDVYKQKKLAVVLRQRTGDALSARELQAIVRQVRRDRQYNIHVYREPKPFAEALVLVRTGTHHDRGKVILGKAWFGISGLDCANGRLYSVQHPTAAQIVRYSGGKAKRHTLHIYIPPQKCTGRIPA